VSQSSAPLSNNHISTGETKGKIHRPALSFTTKQPLVLISRRGPLSLSLSLSFFPSLLSRMKCRDMSESRTSPLRSIFIFHRGFAEAIKPPKRFDFFAITSAIQFPTGVFGGLRNRRGHDQRERSTLQVFTIVPASLNLVIALSGRIDHGPAAHYSCHAHVSNLPSRSKTRSAFARQLP